MRPRFYRQCVGLLAVLAWCLQGCAGDTQSAVLPPGTRQMVWIDLSSSISEPQRQAWRQAAETIVTRLAGGDTITVFGVHEATLGAAPLYLGHLPVLSPDAGLQEKLRVLAAQNKVREEVRAAFGRALTGRSTAQQTDLFGVLDRIHPDDRGRLTLHYFFSDMLHVTRELNMEKTPLAQHIPELVQKVIRRHGWQHGRLDHTTVHCILPGVRGNGWVNSRQVVARFWNTLFEALGAKIATFETHLPAS